MDTTMKSENAAGESVAHVGRDRPDGRRLLGCPPQAETVKVLAPQADLAPIVTVGNFALVGSEVDQAGVKADAVVTVTLGDEVMVSASALNDAGGVKSLSFDVYHAATVTSATNTAALDFQGNAPTLLSMAGHNGAGGLGPTPFMISMPARGVAVATATNFNNQPTTVTVQYIKKGDKPMQIGTLEIDWVFADAQFKNGLPLSWDGKVTKSTSKAGQPTLSGVGTPVPVQIGQQRWTSNFTFNNLQTGLWAVTAGPNFGKATCLVAVPGFVRMTTIPNEIQCTY